MDAVNAYFKILYIRIAVTDLFSIKTWREMQLFAMKYVTFYHVTSYICTVYMYSCT